MKVQTRACAVKKERRGRDKEQFKRKSLQQDLIDWMQVDRTKRSLNAHRGCGDCSSIEQGRKRAVVGGRTRSLVGHARGTPGRHSTGSYPHEWEVGQRLGLQKRA